MKTKTLLISLALIVCSAWTSKSNAQDIINLSITENIGTVLSTYAGSATSVTVVIPLGYTSPEYNSANGGSSIVLTGIPATIKNLTIEGDGSNPTLLVKNIDLPATGLTSFTLKNLTIKGLEDPASTLSLYVLATTSTVTNVSFIGCSIANVRGVARLKPNANITNLTYDNCIFRNIGSYNVVTTETGSVLTNFTCKNSTVYGVNGTVFGLANQPIATATISDCTFDNIGYVAGKYFVDFGSNTIPASTLSISNCIIGKTISQTYKGIRGGTGFAYTVTNSFKTTDWVTSANAVIGFTDYPAVSTSLFTTPTIFDGAVSTASIGNYKIKDSNFEGKNSVGDPRWYINVTGVSNPQTLKFTIYPNPTTDKIFFGEILSRVEVIDLLGKVAKLENNVSETNLKSLSAGTYIVRTLDANGQISIQKVNRR